MAKVLLFSSHILWTTHYETELEIMQRHLDKGDEVVQLVCNASLPACDTNPSKAFSKCVNCIAKRREGVRLLTGEVSSVPYLLLEKQDREQIRNFKWEAETIADLKEIIYQTFDVGYAVASSLISLLSNPNPAIKENREMIDNLIYSSLEVYHSVINHLSELKPDVFYVFNGRLAHTKAAFRAALKTGVKCLIHERGSTFRHYELYENHLPHDLEKMAEKIKAFWRQNEDEAYKKEKAAYFFENRRKGKILSWKSFTENQQKGLLPAGFSPDKKNIMIFNSSEFEFASVGPEWDNPLYKNQNEGILRIVTDMSAHKEYHFYVRLHPNLTTANPDNYRELLTFKAPNFTLIMPDDNADSYHLLDMAHKVVTFGSTMGIEAVYWDKVSIMAGHSMYEALDAVYRPATHQELLDLLVDDELKPKDKTGAYIFGYYYATSGIMFKYYQPYDYKSGKFKNVELENPLLPDEQKWMNRYWAYRHIPVVKKGLETLIIKKLSKTR